MDFLTCEVRKVTGETVGVLVLQPKEFRTGSRGYFASGKIELDGVRYQCQAQAVAIGSKATGQEAAA
ncbi:MAG: hypothetical protein GX557_13685 [Chloroflexi bacterium]|nr:hypothetical protein [Chloroflexota bacterium]